MRQIILDTETTGLRIEDGNRIIEIGCVELIDRKLTGNHYHQYINPLRESEVDALAVHGITAEFLQTKPLFHDVVDDFLEFISDAELIIHNAPFDMAFINHELKLLRKKIPSLSNRVIDSLEIAKQLHIGQRNSLDALCKRYFVDNSQRELHGALLDANLLARVYLAMTGGQGSLFEVAEDSVSLSQFDEGRTAITVQFTNLPVIHASDEELALHNEQLLRLSKRSSCLWLEES